MTRVAFPVTDVDRLAGAAERRDAVDSDGAAGARDRLAPTRIGLTLPTATRAGCPERCELMDEYADSCNKVDTTWLRLLSEQMFSPPITRLCYRDLPVTRVPGLMWALTNATR